MRLGGKKSSGSQEAELPKVAPKVMQHGLELSKSRDRVPGGECWLLTEVPWTVTEDCRREQPVLVSVLLPKP